MTRIALVRGAKKTQRLPLAEVQDGRVSKQQLKAKPRRRPKLQAKRKPKVKAIPPKIVSAPPAIQLHYPETPAWKPEDFADRIELGTGGFSTVYLVENKSRRQPKPWAVLKVMMYSKKLSFEFPDAIQEYSIHKPLRHENITKTFGYMSTITDFSLVLEYCERVS